MPEFNESRGYKMKGFSYPGKSPIKGKRKQADKLAASEAAEAAAGMIEEFGDVEMKSTNILSSKPYRTEESPLDKKAPLRNIGGALASIFTKEVGEAAMEAGTKAVVSGGVKLGMDALKPKNKPGHKSADTSGFSGINFGRQIMSAPFKMKGYSYPGKSPIKNESKQKYTLDGVTRYHIPLGEDSNNKPITKSKGLDPSKVKGTTEYKFLQTQKQENKLAKEKAKQTAIEKSKQEQAAAKIKKKSDRSDYFSDLATQAAVALAKTGVEVGVTSLMTKKPKPTRGSSNDGGFSQIQFGRKNKMS